MEILELESWNIEAPLPPLEALRNVWVAPYHNVGHALYNAYNISVTAYLLVRQAPCHCTKVFLYFVGNSTLNPKFSGSNIWYTLVPFWKSFQFTCISNFILIMTSFHRTTFWNVLPPVLSHVKHSTVEPPRSGFLRSDTSLDRTRFPRNFTNIIPT